MEARNPFEGDVCGDLLSVTESVEGMHEEVLARLLEAVDMGEKGMLVLLTAPRAGHGKTHLLGRLAGALKSQALVVPVTLRAADEWTQGSLCQRGIDALWQAPGERAGWTRLREVSGEVVAGLTRQLIEEGQLACANRDQAVRVLGGSAVEVFDEKGAARLIGGWLKQNRDQLRHPLTVLATRRVSPEKPISPLWMEALVDQAAEGGAAGVATMQELTSGDEPLTWLRLARLTRPLVMLVDHLDGLHRNVDAGVKVAALLSELAEVHRIPVVLSVNQDLWQGTFGSHLPSALEDRLTEAQVSLRGLTVEDAEALVKLRLENAGVTGDEAVEFGRFLATDRYFLGRPVGSVALRAFLRHAARQWEMFKNSVPPPEETGGASPWLSVPPVESGEHSVIPLMPEEPVVKPPATPAMPAIFDADTTAYAKELAQGLATPQAEEDERHEPQGLLPAPGGEGGSVAPSPDAFEKLREMLGKLRQPSPGAAESTETAQAEAESGGSVAVAEPEEEPKEVRTPADVLQGRYEALRLQMSAEADSQPLDFTKLGELIRLAGRRFPLVRLSEHELPGTAGRQVMSWSVQGMEVVFGMANFSDASYWKNLSAFAEGKLTELGSGAKLKVVTFKTDREQAAYQAMVGNGVLAEAVRERLDAIHLDAGSVASLYAMQRIVREAETGALEVEPAKVMSAMARELDFFWRRVTRLG